MKRIIFGTMACLLTVPPASPAVPENPLPAVFPNHVFMVLDSPTYRNIESSVFLKEEFAVFEKRTTIRRDSRYTGIYFYGDTTYFELFDAAAEPIFSEGFCGLALGVDGPGELEQLRTALAGEVGGRINRVTRGLDDRQLPWFRMMNGPPRLTIGPFIVWVMEYEEGFLRHWHADRPPAAPGVDRKSILRRYAHVLHTDPESRLFRDLAGITVAVDGKIRDDILRYCVALGFQAREENGMLRLENNSFTIRLRPASDKVLGILELKLRVRRRPDRKEFRFGPGCVLKFHGTERATWTF